MTTPLPVEAIVPEVELALAEHGAAVLVAEPGAGKTTALPWRLLGAPWLGDRRIVMLEPRRIAARAAAARLAWHLGESVGDTVGYRVRFDTRVSGRTRLEVVTEGVLTRLLADDPSLERYGLVILDEFHERSVPADLGLALTLQARSVFRPDLRVLVMSATLDAAAVARVLGGAPVIASRGRVFPVETRYRPARPDRRLEGHVAAVVREALAADDGDVLVFLPGAGEIGRVARVLGESDDVGARVQVLHGMIPADQQDAVLAGGPERRIILASAIAETSLTVPGVRIVIDSGLMRVSRFSARTGMSRLETVRVTLASADQRRGRAGRTAPGVCYRLWSPAEEAGFLAHRSPEIISADLAPLALDLAAAGVVDAAELQWLDPPPAGPFAQARELLGLLGALDPAGRLTDDGRRMAALPLHPRLAHLVVRARGGEAAATAAALAALLSDRDPARRQASGGPPDADVRLRLEALERGQGAPGFELDRAAAARLRTEIREWRRRLGVVASAAVDPESAGALLAWAYPDRVAQRRGGAAGRFLLANGRGATLSAGQSLARSDYLVAVDVDDRGVESRIDLAAPLDAEALGDLVAAGGRREAGVEWDDVRQVARGVERLCLGAIVVSERSGLRPDPVRARAVALAAVARAGLDSLPWTAAAAGLRQRLAFLHGVLGPPWPDVSDAGLLQQLDQLLGAYDGTVPLREINLAKALSSLVRPDQRPLLDRLAPPWFEVPTGSKISIDYTDPAAPVLAVRLQELFGETTTPSIAGGAVPLTVHLLSPAGRPVQVTRDLAGFWRTSYFDVRKDMKGRYPRHEWPEDPFAVPPTRRPKRRGT